MKCHYTIDPKTKTKVFIPMCYGTIHSLDKEDCCCDVPLTKHKFEKDLFNKLIQEKNQIIKNLESELNHLRKQLKTK